MSGNQAFADKNHRKRLKPVQINNGKVKFKLYGIKEVVCEIFFRSVRSRIRGHANRRLQLIWVGYQLASHPKGGPGDDGLAAKLPPCEPLICQCGTGPLER